MPTLTASKTKKKAPHTTKKIRAAKGAMFSHTEANSFVRELTKRKLDEVSAEDLVSLAGDESSVFHNFIFRQDNIEAAYAHRVGLARHILNHLEVTWTTPSGEITSKCFYSIGYLSAGKRLRVYKGIKVVRESKADQDEILDDFLADVVQIINTYSRYEALFGFDLAPLRALRTAISKKRTARH